MPLYCSQGHANPPSNRFCEECGKPLPLAVGQILENRYRIVSQLGQGGFGRTFLAEDINRSNQSCVLKEFAPQAQLASQLQKAKELFEREAAVLSQLQHSQIPGFREMLQANLAGQVYFFLVQDYVEGDTYSHLLEARQRQELSFSEVEVHQLLCQILPVLSYIHSLNVIHRDISPDNLILRSSDHLPVLIDFGGVKQLPATPMFWFTQLVVRTRLGKKGYAPEEQMLHGKVFPSSDLYALAVTALVLLTGKEPQALYDSYKGTWLWGREINPLPQLEAVLKKMLAYKPGDRYQTAQEVLQALQSPTTPLSPSPSISQMRTINFVGRKPDPNSSYSHRQVSTQVIAAGGYRIAWLRPCPVKVARASLVVLIGMGSLALVNVLSSKHSLPLIQQSPSTSLSSSEKTRTNKLLRRRQALGIKPRFFNSLVNDQFYAKHPEVRGLSLKNDPENADLRQEWYRSAEELLDQLQQAQLSAAARGKLGSYSQQEYEIWKGKANRGELGSYTMAQLVEQTDQRFYQLFPQQRGEKRNFQTFGQIWDAILADKVGQLETGK